MWCRRIGSACSRPVTYLRLHRCRQGLAAERQRMHLPGPNHPGPCLTAPPPSPQGRQAPDHPQSRLIHHRLLQAMQCLPGPHRHQSHRPPRRHPLLLHHLHHPGLHPRSLCQLTLSSCLGRVHAWLSGQDTHAHGGLHCSPADRWLVLCGMCRSQLRSCLKQDHSRPGLSTNKGTSGMQQRAASCQSL